jgi:hypothetical protein
MGNEEDRTCCGRFCFFKSAEAAGAGRIEGCGWFGDQQLAAIHSQQMIAGASQTDF